MLSVFQVANYFIFRSIPGSNENITNLKLQKLLYFAQGQYLSANGLENDPLFGEEIKAWAHGPVVPQVYRRYSDYKFMEINRVGTEEIINEIKREEELQGLDFLSHLNTVWEKYKRFNGKELERKTHEEGPWKDIRGDLPPYISTDITIPLPQIYEHFATQLTA
ncbi:Panacea domain-containing protein [Priestia aryabhattai]|uniref:Panacea domain-containing protein n=1 Tax=Priestia aryabhattai TaxID=412384 RepID=UPI000BEF877A|nr:type II toxin-antitoxin system antitoxin SocA domain-containing protein [Priestia aryabhattai]PEI55920.1 hypothetical protein CN635_16875 [Priestia aryabhattai]